MDESTKAMRLIKYVFIGAFLIFVAFIGFGAFQVSRVPIMEENSEVQVILNQNTGTTTATSTSTSTAPLIEVQ